MADSERVERLLAVTRASFRASPDARERVRTELTASGHWHGGDTAGASSALRGLAQVGATGVARTSVALLAGATFIAGFWLRGAVTQPEPAAQPAPAAVVLAAPASEPPAVSATPARADGQAPAAGESSAAAPPPSAAAAPDPVLESLAAPAVAQPPKARAQRASARAQGASAARDPRSPARERSAGEELNLLRRAEHSIRAGEPDLALTFLDDLERRYPGTLLGEERAAARLMARCARGDESAKADAARFLQSQPASVYSERVRALCALDKARHVPDGSDGDGH